MVIDMVCHYGLNAGGEHFSHCLYDLVSYQSKSVVRLGPTDHVEFEES
jgi:hypothetical protein